MINALAPFGHAAEIFIGEALTRTEEMQGSLRSTYSLLSLVSQA